jgi:6-phospho-3-hexuloisomerase
VIDLDDAMNFLISEIGAALEQVPERSIEGCIDHIVRAKRIFVYGVGRSGLVGQAFAVRLVQMGLNVHFVGDTTTPIVKEGDLLIVLSNTGETMSAVQTANIVRRLNASVVAITGKVNSKLAHTANLVIVISDPASAQKERTAPLGTVFEDAALVFLDSLVPKLMVRLGQTESSMRGRHAIWV